MSALAAVKDQPLQAGLRIGRYELVHRLAVGGMAELYVARATGIERFEKLVVLKRILPQFARNADFVSMFLDEARLSATLQHPNIAQVYDIGQYEGSYFFTMEYVLGEDVRTILKTSVRNKTRVPLENTLSIIAGAAAGLHAAHEKCSNDGTPLDIVHRDVSPANVIVSYAGGVKLLDFGVAKASERQTQTQAGTLKGKVAYMSPEQCKGGGLDRRSDIFALGILLYEMTTRRRLFKGESEFEIMTKIVNEDVPAASTIVPDCPPGLDAILCRALQRQRDERYATAQEMQLDIEELAGSLGLPLSTVKLANFMKKTFVAQMREAERAVRVRPKTAEVGFEFPGDAQAAALGVPTSMMDRLEQLEEDSSRTGVDIDAEDADLSIVIEYDQSSVIGGEVQPVAQAASGGTGQAQENTANLHAARRRWPLVVAGGVLGAVAAAAAAMLLVASRDASGNIRAAGTSSVSTIPTATIPTGRRSGEGEPAEPPAPRAAPPQAATTASSGSSRDSKNSTTVPSPATAKSAVLSTAAKEIHSAAGEELETPLPEGAIAKKDIAKESDAAVARKKRRKLHKKTRRASTKKPAPRRAKPTKRRATAKKKRNHKRAARPTARPKPDWSLDSPLPPRRQR